MKLILIFRKNIFYSKQPIQKHHSPFAFKTQSEWEKAQKQSF
jgi:hypothetical protein